VVFDYALLPASVVPNVRSTARQRRPARVTTAAWPGQEEEQATGMEGAGAGATEVEEFEARPEAENEPVGRSWAQHVRPVLPATPTPPEVEEETLAPLFVTDEVLPMYPATDEDAPPEISSMDDEWAVRGEATGEATGETMEQAPMDETMLFYAYEEVGGQAERADEQVTEHTFAEDARREAEQEGPEPIHLGHEESAEAAPKGEAEGETTKFQKPGTERKRPKSGRGRSEGQTDATKDAPETL
jgi:hypothetical protein